MLFVGLVLALSGSVLVEGDLCPDKSQCPNNWTCCKIPSGKWGCCPLPQAVCCSDHVHCCPHGLTCDVHTGACQGLEGSVAVPWVSKVPAIPREQVRTTCGGKEGCVAGSCCKTTEGTEACCPLAAGVCCKGADYCCPHGTTCNSEKLKCEKKHGHGRKVPVFALRGPSSQCGDQESFCGDGQTCCNLPDGEYGCCPLDDAVCCTDGRRCCPRGSVCDEIHRRCDFSVRTDGCGSCGETSCCKKTDGTFGCCPNAEESCCRGKDVCCPRGYRCVTQGRNTKCARHGRNILPSTLR